MEFKELKTTISKNMANIRPLDETSISELHNTFNEAYEDHEANWTRSAFETMIQRRGYNPQLSFGAFDGNQLVSFVLNGTGMFNGISTAYNTGTGTLRAYRGKGLATAILRESFPHLRKAGIVQCVLEVLQYNTAAVSVYENVGFRVSRELKYFTQPVSEIKLNVKHLPEEYTFRSITLDPQKEMTGMWDFTPTWQNSFEAVTRKINEFKIIGTYFNNELVGYGIIDPSSGDITQLVVSEIHRSKGVGSGILKELMKYNTFDSIKIVNTEYNSHSFNGFIANNNIPLKGRQFEMIKNLTKK